MPQCILRAAKLIADSETPVVAVTSAMSGVTDELLAMASFGATLRNTAVALPNSTL